MKKSIAQVAVGLPLEGHFDYYLSPRLQGKVNKGQRVLVPFRATKKVGIVVGLAQKSKFKKLRPVYTILDSNPSVSLNQLKLAQRFSEYSGCSLGEAIEASLPTSLRKPKKVDIDRDEKGSIARLAPSTTLLVDPGNQKKWQYINAEMTKVLKKKKGVLFLVPEASMIENVINRLNEFVQEPIITLGKKLKDKEELDHWLKIKKSGAAVVVGTRSAIFAPINSLGLIVVYDEENPSFKQEQTPFYHARDLARIRAEIERCSILLVSSAPTAESWHLADKKNAKKVTCKYKDLSKVQLVDLGNFNPRKTSIVTFPLRNVIEQTLKEKGNVILLLNRRGFSTMTKCNKCGHTVKCGRCNVNMTYLYSKKKLKCRLCGAESELKKVCPECKSSYIRYLGTGIEKLESELARVFPAAKVARVDKETSKVPQGADIIIATQAILKMQGALSANVVAVLRFDSELHKMDYRSAQRAFTLLYHLRQMAKEKLVIQTLHTDNYCIKAAQKDDFPYFYRQENRIRKDLGFPPYKYMAAVCLRAAKEETAYQHTVDLYEILAKNAPKSIEISDPHPDATPKLRGKYRFNIILKGKSQKQIMALIKKVLKGFKKGATIVTIDGSH